MANDSTSGNTQQPTTTTNYLLQRQQRQQHNKLQQPTTTNYYNNKLVQQRQQPTTTTTNYNNQLLHTYTHAYVLATIGTALYPVLYNNLIASNKLSFSKQMCNSVNLLLDCLNVAFTIPAVQLSTGVREGFLARTFVGSLPGENSSCCCERVDSLAVRLLRSRKTSVMLNMPTRVGWLALLSSGWSGAKKERQGERRIERKMGHILSCCICHSI